MRLPEKFEDRMKKMLGDEYDDFIKSMDETPIFTGIRINTSKVGAKDAVIKEFGELQNVPWCSDGFYADKSKISGNHPYHLAGLFYFQEPSAMSTVSALNIKSDDYVLDLCAAPGGKSTDAVASLPVGSLIVSNEVIPNRAHILTENIVKWGSPYCIVTRNEASAFGALEEYFDIIAADVPCSGEGMFRKDPAAITEWSAANVAHCAERQRAILTDVWNALRPGGLFIYSTCTYNTEENEEMIGFLRKKFGAIPLTVDIDPAWNITPALVGDLPAYRFMPHRTRGEGLFMAILRKPGEPGETRREALLSTAEKTEKRNKKNKTPRIAIPDEWRLLVANPDRYTFISDEEKIIAIPAEYTTDYKLLDRHLDLLHTGITVATLKGKDYVPHISLALSTAFDTNQVVHYEASLDTALAYLRRESLFLPTDLPRGYILVTYEGFPLGWAKHLGNRTNNLYPQEWRIRSGYTPDTPFELNIAPK